MGIILPYTSHILSFIWYSMSFLTFLLSCKHQPTMTSLQHFRIGNARNITLYRSLGGWSGVVVGLFQTGNGIGITHFTSTRSIGQTTITLNLRLGVVVVWNLDLMCCNATCGIRTACSTRGRVSMSNEWPWNLLSTFQNIVFWSGIRNLVGSRLHSAVCNHFQIEGIWRLAIFMRAALLFPIPSGTSTMKSFVIP